MRRVGWFCLGAIGLLALGAGALYWWRGVPSADTGSFYFQDVMPQTGIRFVHDDGSSGHRYIMEPMSAGLALFDYNDDGLTDIYFLNGAPLRGWQGTVTPRNALYRNDGGWKFTDVTDESGTGDTGFGLGVTIGDYDNDGHADIYLNNYGPNVLYHNNGDGTFSDVTAAAGANNGAFVGAGASFLDIEADGDLDLYVGNYLDFRYEDHVDLVVDGIPSYPSPRQFAAVPDTLFRNNGDGTFADISRESGVGLKAGTAMGLVSLDADNDGDTDVCVMNDVDSNFFFQNDGKGNFEEIGVLNGTAYNRFGDSVASMGVDCGDVDHDGWLDLMTTSYQDEMAVMYRNAGDGFFEDVTDVTGATGDTFAKVKWGTGLVDFDNDADLDIFIANGHTEDNIEMRGSHATYRTSNNVMENMGHAKFVDVTARAGEAMQAVHAARGSAFGDLDEDGLVDAVLLNSREAPSVLKTGSPHGHHWLALLLRGVTSNRDAVGTQVRIQGQPPQLAEVHSGRSYQSHYGSVLHFGLGRQDRVARIEIRWHGGSVQVLEDVPADQQLIVVQGQPARVEPQRGQVHFSGGNGQNTHYPSVLRSLSAAGKHLPMLCSSPAEMSQSPFCPWRPIDTLVP